LIKLENLTKIYNGELEKAVNNLNLEVPEGEICVFVGPSGCGKTTTLKMINRLVEPSSGKIYINGINAVEQNKSELRRKIGYVIQQIGLFPHMTVKENIAAVPRLLEWEETRIEARVNQLLELIGLEADKYLNKYPKNLSGGEKQRIGVARAMAADPPLMLMDEPFGAVDPITRADLQNEFLRLQQQIKKTICFVTHDIDEAIKMGDKIAVMNKGSLVQYDTPKNILYNPKNEFVEDFIGVDRGLKILNLLKIEEIIEKDLICLDKKMSYSDAVKEVEKSGRAFAFVKADNKFLGYVNAKRLKKHKFSNWQQYIRELPTIKKESSLKDALNVMIESDNTVLAVTDKNSKLLGKITMDSIKSHISREYSK